MKLDEIRQALRTGGLERLADEAERLTQPAIVIAPQATNEDELPVGASKLGGRPDLPLGTAWPERDGRPLGFLAQFSLADVAHYDLEGALPRLGLLSFFYDFVMAPLGTSPQDRDGWRVVYFKKERTRFARAEWPEAITPLYQLPSRRPVFSRGISWTCEPYWNPRLPLKPGEHQRFIETYGTMWQPQDQLLGFPMLIDYEAMPLLCELTASNSYFFPLAFSLELTVENYEVQDETIKTLLTLAYERWRLLYQFQLDDIFGKPLWELRELGNDLARGGLMYFWIENNRLAQRDFSNVWLASRSES